MEKQPITILLVEDDEILSSLLKKKLESRGYAVGVVAEGDAGLRSIQTSRPDILLLDMLLPFKNGLDILEELHREGILPSLPVIIISNSGQPVDIDRAKKLGVRDWLVKAEIEPADILSRVERVAKEITETGISGTGREKTRTEPRAPTQGEHAPTILFVEDDPLIGDMLRQKLAEKQYTILSALSERDIDAALEAQSVDLILLDILLPDLNGFSVLKKVKEDPRYKDIPVLIISNLGQREDIERGMAGGAADYIIKAHTYPSEIVKKVETLLKNKSV